MGHTSSHWPLFPPHAITFGLALFWHCVAPVGCASLHPRDTPATAARFQLAVCLSVGCARFARSTHVCVPVAPTGLSKAFRSLPSAMRKYGISIGYIVLNRVAVKGL